MVCRTFWEHSEAKYTTSTRMCLSWNAQKGFTEGFTDCLVKQGDSRAAFQRRRVKLLDRAIGVHVFSFLLAVILAEHCP